MYRQLPLGLRLRDSSLFSTYFAGRNQPVVDALLALPRGAPPTCVWLHGPVGVGKTHLLQAMCAHAGAQGYGAAYVPLREAASFGAEAVQGYGEFTLVCVDDINSVAGQDVWERALFQLHQELEERGGRLLAAAPTTPGALPLQLRDLASRLNGGLVMTLQPLADEEPIEALKLRARHRGLELPEETALFLLRRLPRDMSSLCAFLDELDTASLTAQRRLTVPFVRAVLDNR